MLFQYTIKIKLKKKKGKGKKFPRRPPNAEVTWAAVTGLVHGRLWVPRLECGELGNW